MAYNPNPPQQKYTASAGQTSFPYLFKVYQDTNLVVYSVPSGSDPEFASPLLLGTDYTVAINGDDGGTVTLTTPTEDQDAITLYRRLPLTRYVEYQTSGDLLAGTLNADQDYQTYLTSDLEDMVTEELSGTGVGSSAGYVLRTGDTMTGRLVTTSLTVNDNDIDLTKVLSVDAISDMLSLDVSKYNTVNARGYYDPNDGGGGIFNYDSSQSVVNNEGTIINGWVRQDIETLNPRMFGAKGDGVTDDTSALVNLFEASSNINGVEGDMYVVNTPLQKTTPCEVNMKNATLDFSGVLITSSPKYMEFVGSEDAEVLLTADAVYKTKTIEVANASGLAVGDTIRIGSDHLYDQHSTSQTVGEIVTIDSISGSTITTIQALLYTYSVADNATISKINMVDGVIVKNVNIIGAGHQGADRTQYGLTLDMCSNASIENVNVDSADRISIYLSDCINFKVQRCTARNAYHSTTGYGISVSDCCQDGVIEQMYTENTRHSTSTNNQSAKHGIPRRITFFSCVAANTINTGDAFDTHTAAEDIHFLECDALSSSSQGFNIECRRATITNCTARNCASNGVFAHNESDFSGAISIGTMKVLDCGGTGIAIQAPIRGSTHTYVQVALNNISIENVGGTGISIQDGTTSRPENIVASNIIIKNAGSAITSFYIKNTDKAVLSNIVIIEEVIGGSGLRIEDSTTISLNNFNAYLPPSGDTDCIYIIGTVPDGVNGVVLNNLNVFSESDVESRGLYIADNTRNINVGLSTNFKDCNTQILAPSLSEDSYIARNETFQELVSGAIKFNSPAIEMDTEGQAVSDTLETINGGIQGDMVMLTIDNVARPITVDTGTGNIRMPSDFTLDDTRDCLTLMNNGSFWIEVSRTTYN